MCDGLMGFGMALWLMVGLGLLALLVLGIFWLVRHLTARPDGRRVSESGARQELEMRYARGEIDREPYLTIRDDLARR